MKNILRALMLAIVMTAFTAAAVTTSYAQDEQAQAEKTALYQKYIDNYKGTLAQKKIAVEAAKQYIEKYGANEIDKQQVDYFKKALPALEKGIGEKENIDKINAVADRFNSSFGANNFDDTYASGRELLAKNPENLDVIIVLGSIGFDESRKATANTKYNADTINYAKQAIQKIESGAKSDTFGAFSNYSYGSFLKYPGTDKKDTYPGRDNALGNLNYKIAYLMYFNQNQKKEAIPYFYKASKYDSSVKNLPDIYQIIGDSYFEEAKRLNTESEKLAVGAGNKDTDESKAKDALAKGYADRAIDAYARAYKIASTTQGVKKEYKDGLYKLLQELFKFRFNGKIEGLDSYVATVMNKPFADPSTAVTPIAIEAAPTTTTSTSTSPSSSLSTTSNTSVSASAQPIATGSSTAKTGTTTTTTAKTATTATTPKTAAAAKTKTPAKKAAPKKKGTR